MIWLTWRQFRAQAITAAAALAAFAIVLGAELPPGQPDHFCTSRRRWLLRGAGRGAGRAACFM